MPATLLVVGGGRMGGALVTGLLSRGPWTAADVCVIEPDAGRRQALGDAHRGIGVAESALPDRVDLAPDAGAVLAVKPDVAEGAARLLGTLGVARVLSIVAGMPSERLEACLPDTTAVVRAMPNMPALVGAGVTAMSGGVRARGVDLDWAEAVLGAVGTVVRVPERLIDVVTGLSGSGPAYVFVVVEALVEAGVLAGLSRDLALTLAVETIRGAGELLAQTGESPEALRAAVTSPGGTTAAGLRALEARAVRSAFIEAVLSAVERARQLAR